MNRLPYLLNPVLASALVAVVLGPFAAPARGAGGEVVVMASRTFSFIAQKDANGTAMGTAEVNNRTVGEKFQLDSGNVQVRWTALP